MVCHLTKAVLAWYVAKGEWTKAEFQKCENQGKVFWRTVPENLKPVILPTGKLIWEVR